MPTFHHRTVLPGHTAEAVWRWHAAPGAFGRLAPPWQALERLDTPPLAPGSTTAFTLRQGPVRWRWEAHNDPVEPPRRFVDTQRRGPFRRWMHTHAFEDTDAGAVIDDQVAWELPVPPLGRWVAGGAVRETLAAMFRFRADRLRSDLARHAAWADRPRLRVGITGARGLVGTALTHFLTTGGHTVVTMVRGTPRDGQVRWDPHGDGTDPADLRDLDAVVHLAGEPIAGRRWSAEQKARILRSRVEGTRHLARALARADGPRVLVSASAVGIYGDRREPCPEAAPAGEGFLAEVGTAWEAAAEPARAAGIRVVHPRIATVVSGRGGALDTLRPLFLAGLGGRLGDGRQPFPWIGLDDLVDILHESLWRDDLSGPVNACAPEIVTNGEFTAVFARVLRRPAIAHVPGPVLRLLTGELGQRLLLEGAPVVPSALDAIGFQWRHDRLEDALRQETGRYLP